MVLYEGAWLRHGRPMRFKVCLAPLSALRVLTHTYFLAAYAFWPTSSVHSDLQGDEFANIFTHFAPLDWRGPNDGDSPTYYGYVKVGGRPEGGGVPGSSVG